MARSASKAPGATSKGVGTKIKAARLLAGLTQTELAEAAGVSFQQVQKYERGVNRVAPDRLQIIAAKTGMPITYFFLDGPAADTIPDTDRKILERLVPWMMSRISARRVLHALTRLNEADTMIIATIAERLASGKA